MAKRRKSVRRPPAALKAPKTLKRAPEEIDLKKENTTLRRELAEALESEKATHQQQTATAEVLKIISRSTFDLQTVLDTLTESACHLCDAFDAVLFMREGELLVFGAHYGPMPLDFGKWPLTRAWTNGRAVLDRKPIHVHDLQAEKTEFPDGHAMAQRMGHRTILSIPLLRGEEAIGSLTVRRTEIRPFSAKQIELVETFADQAVIAIENVRLINETKEALERQTATVEILQVINSSPGTLAPVFDAILEKAHRFCAVAHGSLQLYDGEKFRAVAVHGLSEAFADRLRQGYIPGPNLPHRRLLEGARFAQVPDWAEIDDTMAQAAVELSGIRTTLFIPLSKDDALLGTIVAARREVRLFSEKEITLLESFAAQAVIAMENARLFEQVQAKTRDLSEALTYQTGSGNILKVIASSPTDVGPVLKAIVENACDLCEAYELGLLRDDGARRVRLEPLGKHGCGNGAGRVYGLGHGTPPNLGGVAAPGGRFLRADLKNY
jgi:GAF domain-containing protein